MKKFKTENIMKTQLSKQLFLYLNKFICILLFVYFNTSKCYSQPYKVKFKIEHSKDAYPSNELNSDIDFKLTFIKNKKLIKLPAYAQVELDTFEFANPYVDNYLWLYPEIIYYNTEIKKWVKFDLNNFKVDYTPILLDPMGVDSVYIRDKIQYYPFLYFMGLLNSYNFKVKIRFYGRLKLEDSILIITSNWLRLK